MNIGGKPSFAMPNFVPFTFEWTIIHRIWYDDLPFLLQRTFSRAVRQG
jgi:hypothetical protein